MSFDDPPTRRLPREPVPPPGPRPPLDDRPVAGVVPEGELLALERRISSLQSWLVALAVLSVVALGVAAWALLSSDDDSSGGGGRTSSALRDDVRELENRLEDRATKGDVSDLADEVEKLQGQVEDLPEPSADAGAAAATEAVDDVRSDLDELQNRVEQLEDQPAPETPEPTTP